MPSGGTPSPIDWGIAASTAQRLIRSGPTVPKSEAEAAVRELRGLSVRAERHVRELTMLGDGLPLREGQVVDRHGWVRNACDGLATLTEGALSANPPGPLGVMMAGTTGMQAGMVLAFLSTRVLGQYDPFGGSGRLLLVAPNIVGARRAMDVPSADFSLWVCLHEVTHRLQFTAVPWLRDYFADQVGQLMSLADETAIRVAGRIPEMVRAAKLRSRSGSPPDPGVGLIELIQSPEQRAVLDRLIALSTLLEGHADHVMDAVGPAVVPSVTTLRSKFTVRRRGGGLLDRILRTALGVEAKIRQYAVGSAFTRHVVDAVGMAGFNVVWTAPDTLPSRAEIADPGAWLRRVLP
ncbi:MAG: zinc-dependent metalloprotease [Kutzneria sp.]|nr:zinc-dependent metalloprotease [Kutzneria sp.]